MEQQQVVQKESLFEVIEFYNEKHYRDFLIFGYFKNSIVIALAAIFGFFVFLRSLIFMVIYNFSLYRIIEQIILLLLFLGIIPIIIEISTKNHSKDPHFSCMVNKYYFYQDYYVNIDNNSTSRYFYNSLVNAFETKEYFYLYISNSSAHIIPKTCFTKNTSEEFTKLLTIKLVDKFKIK